MKDAWILLQNDTNERGTYMKKTFYFSFSCFQFFLAIQSTTSSTLDTMNSSLNIMILEMASLIFIALVVSLL